MAEQTIQTTIRAYVARRLRWLQGLPEHPQKAALANLRRGVGCVPGDLPELWGTFLQDFPPELESKSGAPTRGEWAIYMALTLYALHQQGHALPKENMHQEGARFGCAVRRLVKPNEKPEESSILRRFNALATASAMPERAQHLRGIVQLLRANGVPLDYVQLAADMYELQFPTGAQRVRLRWGQDFYRQPAEDEVANPNSDHAKEN